jgi:hypothetical protein
VNAAPDRPDCIDEAARLLPWYLNGTLAESDARLVATHLERCATCRSDAAGLGRVRAVLRSPEPVEHAPHAGLHRLMQRVAAAEALDAASGATRAPMSSRGGRGTVRWLAAAVVVQAVALAVFGAALFGGSTDEEARFRTLTAPTVSPPAAALRVAFAPTMTLAEVQELLHAHRLAVLAGPSEAGLFTLAISADADAAKDADGRAAALARLRADPRVRFAEPLGVEAVAR